MLPMPDCVYTYILSYASHERGQPTLRSEQLREGIARYTEEGAQDWHGRKTS